MEFTLQYRGVYLIVARHHGRDMMNMILPVLRDMIKHDPSRAAAAAAGRSRCS